MPLGTPIRGNGLSRLSEGLSSPADTIVQPDPLSDPTPPDPFVLPILCLTTTAIS